MTAIETWSTRWRFTAPPPALRSASEPACGPLEELPEDSAAVLRMDVREVPHTVIDAAERLHPEALDLGSSLVDVMHFHGDVVQAAAAVLVQAHFWHEAVGSRWRDDFEFRSRCPEPGETDPSKSGKWARLSSCEGT